jgi:hypothetical protein
MQEDPQYQQAKNQSSAHRQLLQKYFKRDPNNPLYPQPILDLTKLIEEIH